MLVKMLHHHNYVNMPTTLKLAIGRGNSYKIARNLTVDKSHYSYTIVTLHPPNIYAFPPYPGPKYYQFHYDRPNNASTHTKSQREEGTWIMPSLYRPSGGPNNTPQSLSSPERSCSEGQRFWSCAKQGWNHQRWPRLCAHVAVPQWRKEEPAGVARLISFQTMCAQGMTRLPAPPHV